MRRGGETLGSGRAFSSFGPGVSAVEIFDARGRLCHERRGNAAGTIWDGKDANGIPTPAGVYFARVKHEDGSVRYRKLLVVK